MNNGKDLLIGALISVLLHGGVGCGIAYVGTLRSNDVVPAMQQGKSSLSVTLLPSNLMLKTDQHDSELAIILTQPDSDIVKDVEPPRDVAESTATEKDADMLTKGVTGQTRVVSGVRIRYPYGARSRGEEGKVIVSVKVDVSGRVRSLAIVESSGYLALDRQAVQALRKARYYAAVDSVGKPRAGEVTVPIVFRLED